MKSEKRGSECLNIGVALMIFATSLSGCEKESKGDQALLQEDNNMLNERTGGETGLAGANRFPHELAEIPNEYRNEATNQGVLRDLNYKTYESISYKQKRRILKKHAVVYLPYGYVEETKYDVFYLMHGGWSNETTYLGTPDDPSEFKNILDNAISQGIIRPMIVVCPTYNNTSPPDSGDYSLAIQLTRNYHNELVNDLIPAVEGKYSTYASDTSTAGLMASRDHRAFCGFSMGSVATWMTFENCLDCFRYFMPSSGSSNASGGYLASIVTKSGHDWDDFFIFAASGTADFAYGSFKRQIESMAGTGDGIFRYGDNETEANLWFLEKEGGTHGRSDALEYFYNGLCWIWNK